MNGMEAYPELAFLFKRRSIRKFTEEPLTDFQIEGLLQAAMAAPSAMNNQPWEFVVVTDAKILEQIRQGLIFGKHIAPLAIAVCGNKQKILQKLPATEFWVQDCSAATQNILLAASAMGLGSVWLGVHPVTEFSKHIAKILALPKHISPLSVIYVGHPAVEKEAHSKYDESHISWQKYGQNKA